MSTTQAQEQRTQFDYLLNALEHAAQSDKPAAEGYGAKRAHRFGGLTGQLTENREAVCEYVNELLAIRAARKDGKS